MKEVCVACANALLSQPAQAGSRVVLRVAFARSLVGSGVKENVAILRNEQHEQSVDEAQYLAVVVLCAQLSRAQLLTQGVVCGMGKETTSQGCDGFLDAIAQLIERACALFMRGTRPFLQPALFRLFGFHAR